MHSALSRQLPIPLSSWFFFSFNWIQNDSPLFRHSHFLPNSFAQLDSTSQNNLTKYPIIREPWRYALRFVPRGSARADALFSLIVDVVVRRHSAMWSACRARDVTEAYLPCLNTTVRGFWFSVTRRVDYAVCHDGVRPRCKLHYNHDISVERMKYLT